MWGKKNSWLVVLFVALVLLLTVCVVVFLIMSGNFDKNGSQVDEEESNNYEQVESGENYETVIEVTNAEGSASTSAGGGVER